MGNIFAASEVVEIAIQIERNGLDFYNILGTKTKNNEAKDIFKFLSGEEEKHLLTFKGILGTVEKYQPQGLDADEYYAYMNALAAESIFTQKDLGKSLALKIKSDAEAIDIGIKAEKDSIVFYEGMKSIVPDDGQKTIDEVIGQEQGHLNKLLMIKKKL